MPPVDNNTFVGVSAGADGVLDDPWAVDLFGLVGGMDVSS